LLFAAKQSPLIFMKSTIRFFDLSAKIFFALTIIFIPFRWRIDLWLRPMPPLYSDYTNFQLFLSDITLIYLLIFWLSFLILNPKKIKAGNPLIWICLIGLTIAGIISIFGSVDPIFSRYQVIRFILLLLLYLYIVNEVQSPVWVIVPAALQIMIQAPIAIWQSLAQSSIGLQIFGELSLNPQILGTSIIPIDEIRFLRAYGLSDHPNILGGSIAFSLIILFAVVLYGNKRQPLLASIIFLISFPALMLTFSRSAWLSFSLATSLMVVSEAFAHRWNSLKRASLLAILSLFILLPFININNEVFEKRITSLNVNDDAPMQERAYLLQSGNTLFVEHSAIGIGLGATPLAIKERFENFRINYQPPHYVPLLVALETGILGGLFYLFLTIFPIAWFFIKWKAYINQPSLTVASALILAIFIVSLFDYYTWYTTGRIWQWLVWSFYALALEERRNSIA
jgi:O-antigen ligase